VDDDLDRAARIADPDAPIAARTDDVLS